MEVEMISRKIIVIASDHSGLKLKSLLKDRLIDTDRYVVHDFGPYNTESVDYPDYANLVCKDIVSGIFGLGILICGSGIGMSIAANRHLGIRCALVNEPLSAKLSRTHNDSNVLALGSRLLGEEMAWQCVDTWLNTEYEGGRHDNRIKKLG